MISKKDLKEYGFNNIEDYFDYIIDSKINGQYSQVKRLIEVLSKPQLTLLCQHLRDFDSNEHNDYIYNEALKQLGS